MRIFRRNTREVWKRRCYFKIEIETNLGVILKVLVCVSSFVVQYSSMFPLAHLFFPFLLLECA